MEIKKLTKKQISEIANNESINGCISLQKEVSAFHPCEI